MSLPGDWIVPDWPAPPNVRAFSTTRAGGVSQGEFASFNLGARSGDDSRHVARNRLVLRDHLPEMPEWLAQRHGTDVVRFEAAWSGDVPVADGAVTSVRERVCAVLTADCLPLLLCDPQGTQVGAVHAGWRGMAAGVIENGVAAMGTEASTLIAWMGPAIGPAAFEVGPEVRAAFLASDHAAEDAFVPHGSGKYLADLYRLARRRLARAGVERVFGGGYCTYSERDRFFSYRRAKQSGRMGTFVWMA